MATLDELLAKLDLSKFSGPLKDQDIDLDTAKAMSEAELKAAGLTLGAAKKLHIALQSAGGAPAPAPVAASPAKPAAAAASKPAAAAGNAAAGSKNLTDINVLNWGWMFGGSSWPGVGLQGSLAGMDLRMFDTSDDTPLCYNFLQGFGNINEPVNIWDVEAGSTILVLKNKVGAHEAADQMGSLMAQIGGSMSYALWSVPDGKLLKESKTPNGAAFMYCSLINSASGAPQLAATVYDCSQCWLYDVGTGALAGKFKMMEGNAYGKNMLRDPTNLATFVLFCGDKPHVVDTRAKGVQRSLLFAGEGRNPKFPATSGGKLITNSGKYCSVIDFGTGKAVHKIIPASVDKGYEFASVAMYGNCVAANNSSILGGPDVGLHFYDLNGAPSEITESNHNLEYGHSAIAMAMNSKYCPVFFAFHGTRSFKNGA